MKELCAGMLIGIGIACSSCCAIDYIKTTPMKVVFTDKNHVMTTTVTTEEGVYRIFTIEKTVGDGVGITAVKIK